MGKTKIEWCDDTWNPIVGCSIVSPGCTNCYAMRTAARMASNPQTPHYHGTVQPSKAGPVWTGKVALAPERTLTAPLRWRNPRRIFVNSMGDLFHESIPDKWINLAVAVMASAPQHTFQVLTKRTLRMHDYFGFPHAAPNVKAWQAAVCESIDQLFPERTDQSRAARARVVAGPLPNVHLGVSCERQEEADERIPHLLQTPAAIRFVSAEPLIAGIDFRKLFDRSNEHVIDAMVGRRFYDPRDNEGEATPRLDWIIVGGESGPSARPMHPDWARSIRDQCKAAGVAFFFKQWGAHVECEKRGNLYAIDPRRRNLMLYPDGRHHVYHSNWDERDGVVLMQCVGKKRAGRLLDGKEHNEFPVIEGDRIQRGLSSPDSKTEEVAHGA